MSTMKSALSKLADLGPLPSPTASKNAKGSAVESKSPVTAVGQGFAFAMQQEELQSKVEQSEQHVRQLEHALADFKSCAVVKKLDPARVRPSSFANRLEDSFKSPEFEKFVHEIAESGGNIQPVRVRPVSSPDYDHEIVFGHRRHRACLVAGVQLLAMVEDSTDREMFEAMTRENIGRNDLTPYEWGLHYKRGLEANLYPSREQMGAANNRKRTHVHYALSLANLPPEVIEAFPSPLSLQLKWGEPLSAAWSEDEEGVRLIAKTLAKERPMHTAKFVFDRLVNRRTQTAVEMFDVRVGGRVVATLKKEGKAVSIKISDVGMAGKDIKTLQKLLQDFASK